MKRNWKRIVKGNYMQRNNLRDTRVWSQYRSRMTTRVKKNKSSEFRTETERRGLTNINDNKEKKTSSKVRGLGEKGQKESQKIDADKYQQEEKE